MSASHADQIEVSMPSHRPAGWQVKLIGELTDVSAGGTPATAEESYWNPPEVPWMSSGEVHQRRVRRTEQHISKLGLKNSAAKVFPKESIVMALAGQGKTRGCVAVLEAEVATNQSLAAIYPSDAFETDFLFHNLDWRYKELRALSSGEGGRGGLNLSIIKSIPVELPSKGEQKKIAAILTTVDDKLDVLARQIEATQTLKQGLMQTLFSRGVGTQDADARWLPHAEFKGTELGDVPLCWDVQCLEALSESITVGIATSTTEHYADSGIPLIRNQNIKEDYLDLSDLLRITPEFDAKNKNKRVKAGDILTVRTGYPGTTCVVPEGLGLVQTFTTLITRPRHDVLHAHFASRYFNSPRGKKLMLHQAAGGAQQNINAGNLKKLLVPVPPMCEQVRIAEVLAAVDAKAKVLQERSVHYRAMKRGLMQKLLTGEWRVKVDAEMAA